MKSILDPSFRYTTSTQTDLRKTFAKVRRELQLQQQAQKVAEAEARRKVSPIWGPVNPTPDWRRSSRP